MRQNQRYRLFDSIYAAYVTHNATQPPAVQSKIQVCYALLSNSTPPFLIFKFDFNTDL